MSNARSIMDVDSVQPIKRSAIVQPVPLVLVLKIAFGSNAQSQDCLWVFDPCSRSDDCKVALPVVNSLRQFTTRIDRRRPTWVELARRTRRSSGPRCPPARARRRARGRRPPHKNQLRTPQAAFRGCGELQPDELFGLGSADKRLDFPPPPISWREARAAAAQGEALSEEDKGP